jgi:hypothetical protein
MLGKILTLEAARAYRYGEWAGNPRGVAYAEGYCAEEIQSRYGWTFSQCSRKNGHRP